MDEIVIAVAALGGLGLVFGVGLGIAAKLLHVPIDERVEEIIDVLPGANCGACGFPGCSGLAEAVASGKAPVTSCPVGGEDVASQIAEIMGQTAGDMVKEVATLKCRGTSSIATDKFDYDGAQDCKAAALVAGGPKSCRYGCMGLGSCVEACEFNAMTIENGIVSINKDRCTSCEVCVGVCPKEVLTMAPYNQEVIVECNSQDMGRDTRQNCKEGCIACGICVKACEFDAIKMDGKVAIIDYKKCTNCMVCAEKCPTKAIEADLSKKPQVKVAEETV